MPALDPVIVAATLALVGTALGSLLAYAIASTRLRSQTRVDNADAGESAAKAADILIGPLTTRVVELEAQLRKDREELVKIKKQHTDELEQWTQQLASRDKQRQTELKISDEKHLQMQAEIDELRGGIAVLVAQLEAAGLKPRYKPKTGPLSEKP